MGEACVWPWLGVNVGASVAVECALVGATMGEAWRWPWLGVNVGASVAVGSE